MEPVVSLRCASILCRALRRRYEDFGRACTVRPVLWVPAAFPSRPLLDYCADARTFSWRPPAPDRQTVAQTGDYSSKESASDTSLQPGFFRLSLFLKRHPRGTACEEVAPRWLLAYLHDSREGRGGAAIGISL